MRTIVRLAAQLVGTATAHAVRTGRTFTGFIEESLGRVPEAEKPDDDREAYRVPTFSSQVRPGVDLDSNTATLEAMKG